MKGISPDSIITRADGIVANKLDDELVMMNISSGEYFGLDSIGARIWELIEEPIAINTIVTALTEEYDVVEAQCKDDVIAFLELLAEKKLILIS